MSRLGLETSVVNDAAVARAAARFGKAGIRLPTFAELAEPTRIPKAIADALPAIDPDAAHPLNLFRVHWYNATDRRARSEVPAALALPSALTGIDAQILVILGDRFPMIHAHKVLAAYGCLVPRLVTGQFEPDRHRAVWPSTGNYCRGGVAISRILGCRGVAVLPEGMSAERFRWLERWVSEPSDIIRTPGSESNVKEIYDACAALERDQGNVILNQFCEFGNYLAHFTVTGPALSRVFEDAKRARPGLTLAAFVAATGSAGTLAAGDYLKERHGARIVAVEALECPTLLYNGYGEHNIQGIGDKHVPFIHNVTNTDIVTAVSDRATDCLNLLFHTETGRHYLARRHGIAPDVLDGLASLGLSGIGNVLAAIKVAKHLKLGADEAVVTVATDDSTLYASEQAKAIAKHMPHGFDATTAAEVWGRDLAATATDHLIELGARDRDRLFNLGYFTWVEQQGVPLEEFDRRRSQVFWRDLRSLVPRWDRLIEDFNRRAAAA
ncbi:MAG: pyridoxal-phosphate dependent enzyme [Alphaproteobacteria bacterium]